MNTQYVPCCCGDSMKKVYGNDEFTLYECKVCEKIAKIKNIKVG